MSEPLVLSMPNRCALRLAALGALLVAVLAALVAVAPAQAKTLSKADRAFVDATVEEAMRDEGHPGVAISISGPRGSYTQTYGVRDLASGKQLRRGDHFRIGSITKTFTANAILQQVEEGNLALSDPLDTWIEGIPYGNVITVRDLLAMQSGVFEYEADPTLWAEFTANRLMPFEREDFLRIMRENPPYFAPGEQTLYTNSNYYLLGLILEQVTGESAEAAITKDVIKPLGLSHTTFATTPDLPPPYSRGYCGGPGAYEDCTAFNPYIYWTDGAIVSTLGDMQKYATELGTGALLSPAMQAERLQFAEVPYPFEGPSTFGYGLGMIRFGTWLGHDGSVEGFESETMYEPKTGAVISAFANLQTPTLSVFSRIYERIAAHLYPGSMD